MRRLWIEVLVTDRAGNATRKQRVVRFRIG
jgi:hypothetical protein